MTFQFLVSLKVDFDDTFCMKNKHCAVVPFCNYEIAISEKKCITDITTTYFFFQTQQMLVGSRSALFVTMVENIINNL